MRLTKRQLMIFDEIFAIVSITWIIYMIAEYLKVGLISNYYDLNIHFIILIILFIFRIMLKED